MIDPGTLIITGWLLQAVSPARRVIAFARTRGRREQIAGLAGLGLDLTPRPSASLDRLRAQAEAALSH